MLEFLKNFFLKLGLVDRKKVLEPLEAGYTGKFVIHDHKAQQHHWDLRLEWTYKEGIDINKIFDKEWKGKKVDPQKVYTKHKSKVLRSFAIPKHRLPSKVNERLMLSETELHSMEYGDFEGELPEGYYGAGTVEIYDKGKFKVLKYDPEKDIIVIWLQGKKIDDVFSLVPAFVDKNKNQWLIIKLDKRKWAIKSFLRIANAILVESLKKNWTKETLRELDDKELVFDHMLTHRGVKVIRRGEEFGDWTEEELIELHDAIVEEAKNRKLEWGINHKTPIV